MSAITIWVVCLSRVLVTVSIYTSSFFYSTDICWLSTPLASLGLWLSGSCKGLACVFEQGFLKLQDAFIRALVAPLVENLSLKLLWVQGVSTQGVIQHCSHSWSGVVAGANGHVQHSLSSNTYIDFLFPYIISFYCSFLSSLSPLPSSFISLSFILLSLSHVSPSPSFQPFYSLPSLFPHFLFQASAAEVLIRNVAEIPFIEHKGEVSVAIFAGWCFWLIFIEEQQLICHFFLPNT